MTVKLIFAVALIWGLGCGVLMAIAERYHQKRKARCVEQRAN